MLKFKFTFNVVISFVVLFASLQMLANPSDVNKIDSKTTEAVLNSLSVSDLEKVAAILEKKRGSSPTSTSTQSPALQLQKKELSPGLNLQNSQQLQKTDKFGGAHGGGNFQYCPHILDLVAQTVAQIFETNAFHVAKARMNGKPKSEPLIGVFQRMNLSLLDYTRFKESLHNVKCKPLENEFAINVSGAVEKKTLSYNPNENSITLLEPFFEDYEKKNISRNKLAKDLLHEASHSVGLGSTPQTDISESIPFAEETYRLTMGSLDVFSSEIAGLIGCGNDGSIEERISRCETLYKDRRSYEKTFYRYSYPFLIVDLKKIGVDFFGLRLSPGFTGILGLTNDSKFKQWNSYQAFRDRESGLSWITRYEPIALMDDYVDEFNLQKYTDYCQQIGEAINLRVKLPNEVELAALRAVLIRKNTSQLSYADTMQPLWLKEDQFAPVSDSTNIMSFDGKMTTMPQFQKFSQIRSRKAHTIRTFCIVEK